MSGYFPACNPPRNPAGLDKMRKKKARHNRAGPFNHPFEGDPCYRASRPYEPHIPCGPSAGLPCHGVHAESMSFRSFPDSPASFGHLQPQPCVKPSRVDSLTASSLPRAPMLLPCRVCLYCFPAAAVCILSRSGVVPCRPVAWNSVPVMSSVADSSRPGYRRFDALAVGRERNTVSENSYIAPSSPHMRPTLRNGGLLAPG